MKERQLERNKSNMSQISIKNDLTINFNESLDFLVQNRRYNLRSVTNKDIVHAGSINLDDSSRLRLEEIDDVA